MADICDCGANLEDVGVWQVQHERAFADVLVAPITALAVLKARHPKQMDARGGVLD